MLACLLPLFAGHTFPTQDPPTPPFKAPAPVKKPYSLDGNNRIEFTYRIVDTGQTQLDNAAATCNRVCKGKVHFAHKFCDDKCDYSCQGRHDTEVFPRMQAVDSDGPSYEDVIKQGVDRFGAQAAADNLLYATELDLGQIYNLDDPKNSIKLPIRCFNNKPCSLTSRKPLLYVYDVFVDWRLYRETDVSGQILITEGPKGTQNISKLLVPMKDKWEDKNYERCLCNVIQEDKETGFLRPERTETGTEHASIPLGGVILGSDPLGPVLAQKNLDSLQFGVVCSSMTKGEATFHNPFPVPVDINIPPGTLLVTDDELFQDVVILVALALTLPPLEEVTLHGPSLGVTKAQLRLGCMEMKKKEPTEKVKYRIMPSTDPIIPRIAEYTNKSRFRGPHDQTRVWIYTDAADYEAIKKVITPHPAPATYIRVLKEVGDAGANLREPRYDACFSAPLLSALDAQPEHMEWFAKEVAWRHPSDVLTWAKDEVSRYPQALGADASKDAPKTAALLIRALCASKDKRVQEAGLRLMAAVPASAREAVMGHGVPAVWTLSWSREKGIADRSKALMKELNPPAKDFILANVPKG